MLDSEELIEEHESKSPVNLGSSDEPITGEYFLADLDEFGGELLIFLFFDFLLPIYIRLSGLIITF